MSHGQGRKSAVQTRKCAKTDVLQTFFKSCSWKRENGVGMNHKVKNLDGAPLQKTEKSNIRQF
jgi:hypothetical protein